MPFILIIIGCIQSKKNARTVVSISENETVEVEYMSIKTRNIYGPIHNYKNLWDLNASAVEVYFGNTEFTFVIMFPNNRTGLKDLEDKLVFDSAGLTMYHRIISHHFFVKSVVQ